MIEKSLKSLIACANVALILAFIGGWAQHQLGPLFGTSSPIEFHLSTAGLAVMLSLFSDICVIFYFIGTSVWMRDQAQALFPRNKERAQKIWTAYQLANKLKGKTFPFATMGIVWALFTFILGGANQVGAIPRWLHPTLATLLLVNSLVGWKFYFPNIVRNVTFLDEVSREIELTLSPAS